MYSQLKKQTEFEEGKKLKAYKDSLGILSIGIGHNLRARPKIGDWKIPSTITEDECSVIFNQDVQDTIEALAEGYPRIKFLDPARRDAVIQMAFQLGVAGVLAFHNMFIALDKGDWRIASKEALDSKWAKQTPARAKRVAKQILTGIYYEV